MKRNLTLFALCAVLFTIGSLTLFAESPASSEPSIEPRLISPMTQAALLVDDEPLEDLAEFSTGHRCDLTIVLDFDKVKLEKDFDRNRKAASLRIEGDRVNVNSLYTILGGFVPVTSSGFGKMNSFSSLGKGVYVKDAAEDHPQGDDTYRAIKSFIDCQLPKDPGGYRFVVLCSTPASDDKLVPVLDYHVNITND